MSHRVTTSTEIKDKSLAMQAAKAAGLSFVEEGNGLRFTSGTLNRAVLDLRTVTLSGDTDHGHTTEKLSLLKLHYSEAKYKLECARQGIMVESRVVNKDGEVELICSMG